MSGFWDNLFGLNYELSIWVDEGDLGNAKVICHENKQYLVKIPKVINKKITLRLRGLGKKRRHKVGDLLLHVWLNKGEDVTKNLWLSETFARNGTDIKLFTGSKTVVMVIPPKSYNGLTIRLKGLGRETSLSHLAPALEQKKRGNLLVKLFVYPDSITPKYGTFEALSTENMALEGWVYRKFDEVMQKLGKSSIPINPLQANTIADAFNNGGWASIFDSLVDHLRLAHLKIGLATSASLSQPGSCKRTAKIYDNKVVGYDYEITVKDEFLDNPFSVAAILAHELCHVVYAEKIEDTNKSVGFVTKIEKATLEEERTVDLLVFTFKIGEFQLRIARDKRLTLGYFNQEVFERMQVIVLRKLYSV